MENNDMVFRPESDFQTLQVMPDPGIERIAVALERIADALEKQNAGEMDIDSERLGKAIHEGLQKLGKRSD